MRQVALLHARVDRPTRESCAVASPVGGAGCSVRLLTPEPAPSVLGSARHSTQGGTWPFAYCGLRAGFLRLRASIFPRHDVQRQPLLLYRFHISMTWLCKGMRLWL
jgi:hypothetical protein